MVGAQVCLFLRDGWHINEVQNAQFYPILDCWKRNGLVFSSIERMR